ncbi:curlin subunit CsgB [Vibrio toranzoniae]|uniref:curlin subunit CsgB n=1 Tax=Vibrio TaxID=662 RepID=UPI001376FAC1|nr:MULTISPECIES: curlin subunit CsgB [Vibrio]MDA0144600.1 curlin subunit CsgB [Vibrio sp. RW]NAZ55222.1 curlin subunit CsgB [Vibrio toranzoniae]
MIIRRKSLIGLTCLYLLSGGFNNAIASNVEGDFLYHVSQDIINDYNDLGNLSSGDLDNYSEINISNAFDSTAIIKQSSTGITANNRAKITQRGGSNSAFIGQSGRDNTALVNQNGSNNDAVIGQLGINSEALISQDGNNNLAVIGQANFSRQSSQLSIDQTGNGNKAYLAGAGGSNLGISQDGHDFAIVNASSSMRIHINQAN